MKTKDFFLSKDEKLEKDQILDKRRRAEIAMKAKENLRKDILKQKKEHNLIYKSKIINPFFQQVKDRTKAAEARQIKKTAEIGAVTNGVNSANSYDNAVAWESNGFSYKDVRGLYSMHEEAMKHKKNYVRNLIKMKFL